MSVRAGLERGFWAALFLTTVARADGNPTADELFRAAKASMARGDIARACAQFEESLRYESASGTQLNLADCEQRAGHQARSLALFQAARERLPPGDFRLPFADERIAALSKQVPEIVVRLRGDAPDGVRLYCDRDELGVGVATRVDAGAHVIVAQAP